jgi:hypothetical protein
MATNILGGEKRYTVAALNAIPTATLQLGDKAFVTDGGATLGFNTTVTGGGTAVCPVFWNGTNWVCG